MTLFQWFLSPGYYLLLNHNYTAALRTRISGEYKGKDRLEGLKLDNSDESNLFLGPELVFTYGENTFFQLAIDFALKNDNPANEIVSKRRILSSFTYRF